MHIDRDLQTSCGTRWKIQAARLHTRLEVHRRAMASDLKCQRWHSKKIDTNSRECYGFMKKSVRTIAKHFTHCIIDTARHLCMRT